MRKINRNHKGMNNMLKRVMAVALIVLLVLPFLSQPMLALPIHRMSILTV